MAAGAGAFAWVTFPALPTKRVYCSAAHRDGQLFVLGGCGGGGRALGAAEVLDLLAQRWTMLPPLLTPRAGAAALTLGKQILVVGGVDAAQSPLASVEVYHVDEGKWEKKAALAQPSMGISAVQRDGAVYALGGMGADTSPQALVRVYEPAKDHWQPLPSMPTPCYGASAFLQGNKIFVLGGRQGKLPVTAFEAFDLETRSWTRYPSVPSRRAFAACAMADGVVFSLGGLQQPGPHNFYSRPHFVNTVEMFDPTQGAWSKPSRAVRMREKRADFVAGCLGGRVVAGTSPAHWSQWKGSAYRRRSGSRCPPCPLAAAPAPAAQRPACSLSLVGWPRVPAVPLKLYACVTRPEQGPEDQPWPRTKCLKTGTGV
ncbi:kelch domain-containing protein 8B isoform X1 [Pogoniulus pusillus]|uniref:kelch domain-containing protein 8B isoform X1 n=1 Tax=Pogoniulus pusillus TaxID=488313 RepID=UPI0030B93E30